MSILFLTKDIMFSAIVLRDAQDLGQSARLITAWPELLSELDRARRGADSQGTSSGDSEEKPGPQLIILDLSFPAIDWDLLQEELASAALRPQIIAYGPHVSDDLLAKARDAGCDLVLTKGQFHREVRQLLSRFCRPTSPDSSTR